MIRLWARRLEDKAHPNAQWISAASPGWSGDAAGQKKGRMPRRGCGLKLKPREQDLLLVLDGDQAVDLAHLLEFDRNLKLAVLSLQEFLYLLIALGVEFVGLNSDEPFKVYEKYINDRNYSIFKDFCQVKPNFN
jgi:hypothetical protein